MSSSGAVQGFPSIDFVSPSTVHSSQWKLDTYLFFNFLVQQFYLYIQSEYPLENGEFWDGLCSAAIVDHKAVLTPGALFRRM